VPAPVPPPQVKDQDREARGERGSKAKDGKKEARESDKESRSSRREGKESTYREEGERRRERSRSRHRNESEESRKDSGRGKKERRFREEKAKPKDTETSHADSPLPKVVEELAAMVAVSGEELEEAARSNSSRAADLDFLDDRSSALYKKYRARVAQLKSDGRQEGKRKRKSRWGAQEESPVLELVPGGPGLALPTALGTVVAPAPTCSTERSPAMKAYAAKIFGGVELTEDQWKHCEIQLQMNTLMTSKPVGVTSTLDDGGTWEHKLRQAEIERTAGVRWHENENGQQADDDPPVSHHISHFLPPEEMAKFMQKQKVWILNAVLPILVG